MTDDSAGGKRLPEFLRIQLQARKTWAVLGLAAAMPASQQHRQPSRQGFPNQHGWPDSFAAAQPAVRSVFLQSV